MSAEKILAELAAGRLRTRIPRERIEPALSVGAARHPLLVFQSFMAINDKCAIFAGELDGRAVAIKLCLAAGYFRASFAVELRRYEQFGRIPPAFDVPNGLVMDEQGGLLVLERVDGYPLSTERTPERGIPGLPLESILSSFDKVQSWSAADAENGVEAMRRRYEERFSRYRSLALFSEEEVSLMRGIVKDCDTPVFSHGDPNPGNILRRAKDVWLIDWELSSYWGPHYDAAMLWAFLLNDPGAREKIEHIIAAKGGAAPAWFAMHALIGAARLERTHSELRDGAPLERYVPGFRALRERAKEMLRRSV